MRPEPSGVDRPHVSLGIVRTWWALRVGQIRGGVENGSAIGEKVSAGGFSLAIRDQANVGAVDVHGEHLVTLEIVARRLKDQFLSAS